MTSDSPSDDPPVEAASLARGADLLRRELAHLPTGPGVYRMVDRHEDVLYVGKARNVRRRVTSYTQVQRLPNRLRRMVAETTRLEVVTTHTEAEALLLESNLIKRLRPRYNILLRDDKSFPYILVTTGQEWPRLGRHRGARGREDAYFGPFASAGSVRQTLTALQRIFLLRSCSDSMFAGRSRPCLLYHIKRCCAPCVGRIDPAGYRDLVDQALAFLSGRSGALQGRLAAEMEAASEALEFEQAAALRDRIRALTAIQAHQDINVPDIEDADVLALHQAGGRSCLQVFFYRGGRNYGNRAYFPRHDQEAGPEDVLTAFLGQFYDNKPPPDLILLDREPAEFDLLREALALRAGHKVDIAVPRRGTRRKLVDHARDNAEQALARHLSESASQRRLLDQVADLFGLEAAPERIEVYDNSHIQGTNALGAMIVAGPDGFLKNAYRKWTIKPGEKAPDGTVFEPGDDYAMMRLVLSRRFARAQKDDPERARGQWPDLVLIDGGRGQLAVAVEALAELGVEDVVLAAIAKGPDRHAGRERLFLPGRDPVALPPRDPVLYYLQRLRDEAHRFAIGGHRQKRSKGMGRSALDEIPGIGPARKRALLNHFGSAKAVTRAGLADLELVEGISGTVARRIYDHFHGDGG